MNHQEEVIEKLASDYVWLNSKYNELCNEVKIKNSQIEGLDVKI